MNALTEITITVTAAEIVDHALEISDFLGDLVTVRSKGARMDRLAADAIDLAMEALNAPATLRSEAIAHLVTYGWKILDQDEADARDRLLDGIAAGDLDGDGQAIPYDRYQG